MHATHDASEFAALAEQYRDALLDDVLPFWQRHSIDDAYGGYFSCLDRTGAVYDTNKYTMMQARQLWMFSALVNRLQRRDDWLEVARYGAAFLQAHGLDAAGNWRQGLDRAGQPLDEPPNILVDCFVAMALGQFALAAGDEAARDQALATFGRILQHWNDPAEGNDQAPRPLTLPMILAGATLELADLLDAPALDATLDACVQRVMGAHLDRERLLLYETAPASSTGPNEGLITVGLGVEAMWIIMDAAQRRDDRALLDTCADITVNTVALAWDNAHGGLFSSVDDAGAPPPHRGGDHKVWWVHLEALIALAMGYERTGSEACWQWFRRVHDYAWAHFADPTYGEWYATLTRSGEVLQPPHKGGRWKTCFHLPRALWLCWQSLEHLAKPPAGGA